MAKHFKLIESVMHNSVSQDWDSAIDEWMIVGYEFVNGDGVCECGKEQISQLNYVRNRYTGHELIVGSECINKFFYADISGIHPSIRRVSKDINKSLYVRLVQTACQNGIISEADRRFYLDIINKRKLSAKQQSWKQSINSKILYNISNINLKINNTNELHRTRT